MQIRKPVVLLIRLYRWIISPVLGPRCRFLPSCSVYADEAIRRYGLFWGMYLTFGRILRCHPFCKHYGWDPVPSHLHQLKLYRCWKNIRKQ